MADNVASTSTNVLGSDTLLDIWVMEEEIPFNAKDLNEECVDLPGEVAFHLYKKRAYKLGYRDDIRERWDREMPDIWYKYRRLAWRLIGVRPAFFATEKPNFLK